MSVVVVAISQLLAADASVYSQAVERFAAEKASAAYTPAGVTPPGSLPATTRHFQGVIRLMPRDNAFGHGKHASRGRVS